MRGRLVVAALLVAAVLVPAVAGAESEPQPGAEAAGVVEGDNVMAFGSAAFHGSTGTLPLADPLVGMAATPTGGGYWLVGIDGGIFSFGDAAFHGSTGGIPLNQPIVGMAPTPTGRGYWLVASDGGVFAFGDAVFHGSTGGMLLNRPVVGMAATRTGRGYWLVASDGGLFAFGDATFRGSTGSVRLNQPVVGMAATPTGAGYWLVASDGGVFAFGDAVFHGSTGSLRLNQPIVGMAATPDGRGYRFVASDGGVFSFGDAPFLGSIGDTGVSDGMVVAMASAPAGDGYWLAANRTGERVSVWEPGGLSPAALDGALRAASAAGARATVSHRGTLGLLRVVRDGEVVQAAPPGGWRYPMDSLAVDRSAAPLVGAQVTNALSRGEVVFGRTSAEVRGARVGDDLELIGWGGGVHVRRVGAIVPDEWVSDAELVFSTEDAATMGFSRPLTVRLWGFGPRGAIDAALDAHLPPIRLGVERSWDPFYADQPASTARLKAALGEFAYLPTGGDGVVLDPAWQGASIARAPVPILGALTCNRGMLPALRGALDEVAAAGLAGRIDVGDSVRNGGCFNARLIRGGDSGGALSRHSWGIAVDINPSQNVFGGRVSMDPGIVDIFRRWGFAWGGTWVRSDGMHFEWRAGA